MFQFDLQVTDEKGEILAYLRHDSVFMQIMFWQKHIFVRNISVQQASRLLCQLIEL